MKKVLSLVLTLSALVCLGQSKKEQIITLNNRVDSLKLALSEETQTKLNNEKRDALKIIDLNNEIREKILNIEKIKKKNFDLENEILFTKENNDSLKKELKSINEDKANLNLKLNFKSFLIDSLEDNLSSLNLLLKNYTDSLIYFKKYSFDAYDRNVELNREIENLRASILYLSSSVNESVVSNYSVNETLQNLLERLLQFSHRSLMSIYNYGENDYTHYSNIRNDKLYTTFKSFKDLVDTIFKLRFVICMGEGEYYVHKNGHNCTTECDGCD